MEQNLKPNQETNPHSTTTTTNKKPRQKTKPVSSRYLTSPSFAPSPTPSPSPFFSDENSVPKAIENQRRRQTRLFSDSAIEEDAHQSIKTSAWSRNPFTSMNLDIHGGARLGNFSNCLMDWGSKRREANDSLCRSSLNLSRPPQHTNIKRPPQHTNIKLEMKLTKEAKLSKQRHEDSHLLRMLLNRYLQWRFLNAKAQVSDRARSIAAEKSLHTVSCEMLRLQNYVTMKRTKFEQLRREKGLANILDAQMPHLDEWRSLEGDYASSLSGTTTALHDALSQLPISENVKADTSELKEVLDSAVILLEVSASVEKFLSKAQEMDSISLEVWKLVEEEKILIEECSDLLSVVHALQVKEYSLRSQLVQVKQRITK